MRPARSAHSRGERRLVAQALGDFPIPAFKSESEESKLKGIALPCSFPVWFLLWQEDAAGLAQVPCFRDPVEKGTLCEILTQTQRIYLPQLMVSFGQAYANPLLF